MGNIKVGLTPANQSEGMEIEEELTSLLPTLDREKIICIVEHLTDVIDGNRPENLNDTITLELCPAASAETSSHPPHPSSSTSTTMYNHYSSSWVSHLQIPWERFPLRLSHAITRGDRAHPEDRRKGPGAVERPDVDDFMCLTYISQRQLINSCPSLSVAEIQEQWPFLFTRKGLSNHFYKLTSIDISERLSQALITKGRRIINYFSSRKLKWNLGIRTLIQQIESEGVLTNNKYSPRARMIDVEGEDSGNPLHPCEDVGKDTVDAGYLEVESQYSTLFPSPSVAFLPEGKARWITVERQWYGFYHSSTLYNHSTLEKEQYKENYNDIHTHDEQTSDHNCTWDTDNTGNRTGDLSRMYPASRPTVAGIGSNPYDSEKDKWKRMDGASVVITKPRAAMCVDPRVGMGIKTRFLLRTGSHCFNSLELFAIFANDSLIDSSRPE
ncbi:F-box and leucine-rich repeat protein 13 [Sarotherodon galilaeus]